MVGLAHGRVVVGRNGVGDTLIALYERLLIHLRSETAVWNLVEVIDMQAMAAHAHVIHHHKRQLTHTSLCLLHNVRGDIVDVALAQTGIAHEMLHFPSVLEASCRHKHRKLLSL